MSQISVFKNVLGNPDDDLDVLQFYLDSANDIICDIRNSDKVETQYLNTQIRIAVELYNKRGAEGQTGHSENGITRQYEKSDISPSLLDTITPIVKTPYSKVRVIVNENP